MKIYIRDNCLIAANLTTDQRKAVNEAVLRLRLTAVPAAINQLLIEGKKEDLFTFLFLIAKDFDVDLI